MEQIIEGLKMALAKGHSIEAAAASFKNAGYPPQEVDAAVHQVQRPDFQPKQPSPMLRQPPATPTSAIPPKPSASIPPVEGQPVSKYEEKPKPKKKMMWILLSIAIFVILGVIVMGFIFKSELSNFFSRLFP